MAKTAERARQQRAQPGIEWSNYQGEQRFTPALTFDAETEDDVAAIVSRAKAEGKRVHVAGAGHSSSPLVRCDGFLVRTRRLSGVTRVAAHELEPGVKGKFVRVLAGTRIEHLNAALDCRRLAMPNLGSAAYQAIYGAIATGTHGSGASLGALADLVRSVDLVDGEGRRLRVEPKPGFTRPAHVPRGVELRIDDDTFYSVVVGLGVAGLVTSLVLQVRDAYDLSETRTVHSWKEISDSPEETNAKILAARHYEMWLNPYTDTALVAIREEPPPGTARNPRRNPKSLTHPFVRTLLATALDLFPGVVPVALDWALRSQATKEPWVDKAHAIYNLGDEINRMPAVASEWFFPMRHWQKAVDALLKEAKRLQVRPHAVGGVPFGVRFIRAGSHFLAMNQGAAGEVFCSVELPVYAREHDRHTLQKHYERVAESFGGRPHWGQLHHPSPRKLEARYPNARKWKEVRARIDPDERFANEASHREGLTHKRVPHPVIGGVHFLDTTVQREVLRIDTSPGKPTVRVDRRRFEVEASAADFVEAFQEVMLEPGFLLAHRFEVIRQKERVDHPFAVGERFQGRFALDEQLLHDTKPRRPWWARLLHWLHLERLLQKIEDLALSNYGEVTELHLAPPPGDPHSIRYAYLTGTPFAGESHFTVEPKGDGKCLYTERITFQPQNAMSAISMDLFGLRLHNKVVFGQVQAAAERLGVRYEALDPDDTGTPTGP